MNDYENLLAVIADGLEARGSEARTLDDLEVDDDGKPIIQADRLFNQLPPEIKDVLIREPGGAYRIDLSKVRLE